MEISVYNATQSIIYKLDLKNRVTILSGNSGIGKSIFVKMIDQYYKSGGIVINSEYRLTHLNYSQLEDGIQLLEDRIYVMDEDDGIETEVAAKVINNQKYKFILIKRKEKLPNITYSIDNIYTFHNSGKYNYIKKKYDNLNINNVDMNLLTKIVVEDSNSGYQFYSKLNNFDVISSHGNGNIDKFTTENSIIIFDKLGFGPYIKSLLEVVRNKNVWLIYPESFEWLLLNSGIVNINKYKNMYIYYDKYLANQNISLNKEQIYTLLLSNICTEYHVRYSKSKLDPWFLDENQYNKVMNKIKDLFNIDLLELNDNLNNEKTIKDHIDLLKWRFIL